MFMLKKNDIHNLIIAASVNFTMKFIYLIDFKTKKPEVNVFISI